MTADRARSVWSSCLGLVLFTSCDPAPPASALGARLVGTAIEIGYAPCPGDQVQSIELFRIVGQVVGDDDELLWRIAAEGETDATEFVVGQHQDGYTTELALTEARPKGKLVARVVTKQGERNLVTFALADLDADRFFTDDGYLDRLQRTPVRC